MNINIRQQFIKYVSQNILGMIGVSCYIIADTFFISRAAGTDGITVLNLVLPVYGVIFAIGSMIGVGAATRFTILKSRGDETADYYFWNALFWIVMISIPFVLLGIFAPRQVVECMGGDARISELGKNYTRIFMSFTPFFMSNYVFTAYVRNDNDPSRAMLGVLCSSFSNIVLDYLLMFPLGMGLEGAALATAVSPLISILICSSHFFGKRNTLCFKWAAPSVKRLGFSCQLGISAFVGELSSAVTTTVFNFLILGLVGNVGVAAYGVVANFALVAVAIFNGISQGAQPLISKCYGKGQKKDMRRLFIYGGGTALVFAVILILVVWGFTDPMAAVFNSEGSVQLADYAHDALRFYFLGYLFAGFNIVAAGYFSAVSCAKEAFLTSILRGFVAITGCACLFARLFGVNGVWFSFAAAEMITTAVIAGMLFRARK